MATIIGVVIAILLGLASLVIKGYQAWVGYQQWQHPISSSTLYQAALCRIMRRCYVKSLSIEKDV
jgi:hypothetical protein